MKKIFFLLPFLLAFFYMSAIGQVLTQRVMGTLTDSDSKSPLIGATVLVLGSNPMKGTTTDLDGSFRLDHIPAGRITLQLSYLGYEPRAIPDIVVNTGKEVVLDLSMQESTVKMAEVVVKANRVKGQALNEMALISACSISPVETSRYAGGDSMILPISCQTLPVWPTIPMVTMISS